MESLYTDFDLNKEIDILTNKALLNEIDDFKVFADFFKILNSLPSSHLVYENSNLWCLISVLKRLNLSSNILNILISSAELNMIVHKIYFQDLKGKRLDTCSDSEKENIDERMFKEISIDPELGEKTVITYKRDKTTGEKIQIDKKIIKQPEMKTLKSIFNGLLTDEINKETEKK